MVGSLESIAVGFAIAAILLLGYRLGPRVRPIDEFPRPKLPFWQDAFAAALQLSPIAVAQLLHFAGIKVSGDVVAICLIVTTIGAMVLRQHLLARLVRQ